MPYRSYKNILIIRFSSLGDIILLTPLFREVRKQFPDSTITFLTSTTFESLCRNNPNIDHIIALDRSKGSRELNRVVSVIRNGSYDLILDAHNSIRSRLLLFKSLKLRYLFKHHLNVIDKRSWKRNLLLLAKINLLKNAISQREAFCNLLCQVTGIRPQEMSTELFPADKDRDAADTILHQTFHDEKPLIAVGPAASFKGKAWPKDYYLELCKRFIDQGYNVILFGGPGEEEPRWISERISGGILDTSGRLTFLQTAALIKKCALTVSNDSAIVHFSEAGRIPVVAIFGPTVQEFGFFPFLKESSVVELTLSCRPCSRNGKGKCKIREKRKCLTHLSVDMVWEEAKRILDEKPVG